MFYTHTGGGRSIQIYYNLTVYFLWLKDDWIHYCKSRIVRIWRLTDSP